MWPHQNCQGDESDLIMKTSTLSKSNQKWDLYKDEIYQFYVEKRHTLPITMNTFEQKYGLKASIRKWKLKLDEWKFNKNLRTDEMLFVIAKGEKRAEEEGKDTIFFHEGSQIKRQKIERFKRRNMLNQEAAENVDARTPEAITYYTPSPIKDAHSYELQPSSPNPPTQSTNEHSISIHLSAAKDGAVHQQGEISMDGIYEPNKIHDPISHDDDVLRQPEIRGREKTSVIESADCYLSRGAPDLLSLPWEVIKMIVGLFSLEEVFALSCTCKQLRRLLTDEKHCESILHDTAPYSKEALIAISINATYASAFRRVTKRRLALNNASPFLCATIGFADSYLYCHGTLCYTLDDRLRILGLHGSGTVEHVVSIPDLLRDAAPEGYNGQTGTFQILYFCHGIVGCIFTPIHPKIPDQGALFIAFHPRTASILVVQSIQSVYKTFTRFNRNFLYFGTNSGNITNGHEEWIIQCYDFRRRKLFKEEHLVPDIAGSHIGSTVCFMVVNDALFAVTNQALFKFEGSDCISFYSCVTITPRGDRLEVETSSEWRRNHTEGPIDDRWTSLHLEIDETEGFLKIIEGRKEWHRGSSKAEMTYYTTNLVKHEADPRELQQLHARTVLTERQGSPGFPFSLFRPHIRRPTEEIEVSNTALPTDSIFRLLSDANPSHLPLPKRTPESVHPVRHGSSQPTFTLAKAKIRSYNISAGTILDLVDDPLSTDWQGRQRLRLRADSRTLGPPLQDRIGGWTRPPFDLSLALERMFIVPPVTYWPPAQNPDYPDEALDKIYKLLNPPSHLGNVEGTFDERSLVYTTGSRDKPQAIIFLSFDPAIRLEGLKRWDCFNWQERSRTGIRAYVDADELDRTVVIDQASSRTNENTKVTISEKSQGEISNGMSELELGSRGDGKLRSPLQAAKEWVWRERAMYRDINLGYHFGL